MKNIRKEDCENETMEKNAADINVRRSNVGSDRLWK